MNSQGKEPINRIRSFSLTLITPSQTWPSPILGAVSREHFRMRHKPHSPMVQWVRVPLPDSVGDQWKPQNLRLKGTQTQYNPTNGIFFPISPKRNTALRYFWTTALVSAEQKVALAQLQVYLFYSLVASFYSSRHLIKHKVLCQKETELLPLHSYTVVLSHSPLTEWFLIPGSFLHSSFDHALSRLKQAPQQFNPCFPRRKATQLW